MGAWFLTSALFGLFHGLDIVTGQSVGATIQEVVVAFVMGSALYLVRRLSGLLIVGTAMHGLWDFSSFIAAGRGDDEGAIPGTVAAAPFVSAAAIVTIAALVALGRRAQSAG